MRTVPMPTRVVEALTRLRGESEYLADTDLVFCVPELGRPDVWVLDRFKAACRRAGIDSPPRVHDLHHMYGTRTVATGVRCAPLRALMGQAAYVTTEITAPHDGMAAQWAERAFAVEDAA